MARLFKRVVNLRLTDADGIGRQLSDLRIDFAINHTDESEPSEGKISVYNAAPDTRSIVQEPGAIVQLLVGYKGRPTQQIFAGNIVEGGLSQFKQGSERILEMNVQDGGFEITFAQLNTSLATQVTLEQVVDQCIDALGLSRGTIEIPAGFQWPNGVVLQGDARRLLTEYTRAAGLRWWVRDRALQIVPLGQTTGEAAPVFSTAAGNLIGSPTARDGGVQVTALIEPSLRPGKPFRVEGTDELDGDYLATEVRFRGGTWSNAYYVDAVGTPLENAS